jgi:hypothetical protein
LLSAAVALLAAAVALGAPRAREATVEAALHELVRYASATLVSETGQGRCDYHVFDGRWRDYEPLWHTGQLVWGLTEAGTVLGDQAALAAARRAGDWWVAQEFRPPHPFAGLLNAWHGDKLGPTLLNWTTISDGTPGLFALSRATGESRYADTAVRSARWLWDRTRVPEGTPGGEGLFYNILDPERGVVLTDWNPHRQGPRYDSAEAHRVGVPPIVELARPNIEGFLFADVAYWTGEPVWRERFLTQAAHALTRQDANGLWMDFEPNDARTGGVHPRFNLWNAEALLAAYHWSGDARFLAGARRTVEFHRRLARPDGTMHYTQNVDGSSRPESVTGSAVAFHGALMLRLRDYGEIGFDEDIERAVDWILRNRFASDHPDGNVRGAVFDTRQRIGGGRLSLVQRDVGTTFALRFLALYLRDRRGEDLNLHLHGPRSASHCSIDP